MDKDSEEDDPPPVFSAALLSNSAALDQQILELLAPHVQPTEDLTHGGLDSIVIPTETIPHVSSVNQDVI